jgi:hypothetical protein
MGTAQGRKFEGLAAHDGSEPLIRIYQMPAAAIQYLTSLTEACDGIGLVRTLDESRGIVECWTMPDFEAEFDRLMTAVGRDWPVQSLAREFE